MKKWYLLVAVTLLFIGCNKDGRENEQEYSIIKIEKIYPSFYEQFSLDNFDTAKEEIFKYKIYLINSLTQLKENPLFIYYPEALKEEVSQCDFDQYSLIIASSIMVDEVINIKRQLYLNNYYLNYKYWLTVQTKPRPTGQEIKDIYFIIDASHTSKIPDDSEVSLVTASTTTI